MDHYIRVYKFSFSVEVAFDEVTFVYDSVIHF